MRAWAQYAFRPVRNLQLLGETGPGNTVFQAALRLFQVVRFMEDSSESAIPLRIALRLHVLATAVSVRTDIPADSADALEENSMIAVPDLLETVRIPAADFCGGS